VGVRWRFVPTTTKPAPRPSNSHRFRIVSFDRLCGPDGSPQSVPVWVGREGDRILICTGEGSLKAKNTRRDPRISLSIVDFHDPYQEAQLRGRVVERRPDGDFKYMDAISLKYTGKPFPFRSPEGRVALVIEIEKARYTKLPFEHTPPQ
jgi:PPOX class probable F420-dependent enzyme